MRVRRRGGRAPGLTGGQALERPDLGVVVDEAEPPARPAVPPSLPMLAAAVCACRLVMAGVVVPPPHGWWALAAAGLACGAAALRREGWARTAGLVGAAALAACLAAHGASVARDAQADALSRVAVSRLELVAESDSSQGRYGYRCRARALCPEGGVDARVSLTSEVPLRLGDVARGRGRFEPSGDDEWGRSQRAQGLAGTVRLVSLASVGEEGGPLGAVRYLRAHVLDWLEPDASDERAVVAGVACGYRAALDARGLGDLFSACGLAHLVAVSGAHLSVVSALLGALLGRLGLGARARVAATLALGAAFVAFCGAPASAVRAWLMVASAAGAQLLGRRAHALSSVCAVALAMALASPAVTGQLGYLLSVLSVVGLCSLSRWLAYALGQALPAPRLPQGAPRPLRAGLARAWRDAVEGASASLVAQAVTAPLVAEAFGTLSLVGPVANVLVALPFSLVVGLGVLALALSWCPLGGLVLWAALALARLVLWALGPLARLPGGSAAVAAGPLVALACWGGAASLVVWWPRVRGAAARAALALSLCLLVLVPPLRQALAPARVCVLDVGQGDAILVQDGWQAVLVDTGPDASAARDLQALGVSRLSAVLLTHLHDDHVGGLASLRGTSSVGRVLVARGVPAHMGDGLSRTVRDLTGEGPAELSLGDAVRVGRFRLEVVWPEGEVTGEENADSVELFLAYDDGRRDLSALLTGDAERDQTGAVVAAGRVGDVDLLKLGHHGSEVSVTAGELEALRPEVCVASAGEGNSYGHPSGACVALVEESGSAFLCTKDVGTVTVEPGASGPRVSVERPDGLGLPDVA